MPVRAVVRLLYFGGKPNTVVSFSVYYEFDEVTDLHPRDSRIASFTRKTFPYRRLVTLAMSSRKALVSEREYPLFDVIAVIPLIFLEQ